MSQKRNILGEIGNHAQQHMVAGEPEDITHPKDEAEARCALGFRDVTLRSGTMPRKMLGERPMTGAERQARHRAASVAGVSIIRMHRPADHRSRARRGQGAVAELTELQAQYAA